MSDPKSVAWNNFLGELRRAGLDFPSVQFADSATRTELLNTMELGVRDKALVSSAWAQIATGGGGGGAAASPSPGRADQSGFMGHSAASVGSPSPIPNRGGGGGNSIDMTGLNLTVKFDINNLKGSLDRGDSGTALPLASEMLQCDPNGLILLLHEYLPHVSVDQLKGMLGIGTVLSANPNMSAIATGDAAEQSSTASLNGQPVQPGMVVTSQSLAAQYGAGFTASCNGAYLSFPYCVQKGDHITVRPMDDRL